MTLSSPPIDVLEAVIADARRHARFRRLRNSAIVLFAFSLAATGIAHVRGGGSQPMAPDPPVASSVASLTVHNGGIAILAGAATGPTDGWYGVTRLGMDGKLQPFVRCPRHAKWCGEPESIAWTVRGDHLALSVTSFGLANPYNGLHVIDMRTQTDTQIRRCNDPPGEAPRPGA